MLQSDVYNGIINDVLGELYKQRIRRVKRAPLASRAVTFGQVDVVTFDRDEPPAHVCQVPSPPSSAPPVFAGRSHRYKCYLPLLQPPQRQPQRQRPQAPQSHLVLPPIVCVRKC